MMAANIAHNAPPSRATSVVPGCSIADCQARRKKRRMLRGASVLLYPQLAFYPDAPKLSFTSALSASSTLNMGCGRTFMKAAMNVSGTC